MSPREIIILIIVLWIIYAIVKNILDKQKEAEREKKSHFCPSCGQRNYQAKRVEKGTSTRKNTTQHDIGDVSVYEDYTIEITEYEYYRECKNCKTKFNHARGSHHVNRDITTRSARGGTRTGGSVPSSSWFVPEDYKNDKF